MLEECGIHPGLVTDYNGIGGPDLLAQRLRVPPQLRVVLDAAEGLKLFEPLRPDQLGDQDLHPVFSLLDLPCVMLVASTEVRCFSITLSAVPFRVPGL